MLVGALGGLGAFLAGSLTRPSKAEAANGDALLVGRANESSADTVLTASGTAGDALRVQAANDGVVGIARRDGRGVRGISQLGIGVLGNSNGTSSGVFGRSLNGIGVTGFGAGHSVGVVARSQQGLGLRVDGLVEFKTSGIASIPSGADQAVVTLDFNLSGNQRVLASLNSDPGNGAAVQWIEKSPGSDQFTVHATEAVDNKTEVAWFVIGDAPGQ